MDAVMKWCGGTYSWKMRREDYEPRGLRWAVDYDAKRVRLMVASEVSQTVVENLEPETLGAFGPFRWSIRITSQ